MDRITFSRIHLPKRVLALHNSWPSSQDQNSPILFLPCSIFSWLVERTRPRYLRKDVLWTQRQLIRLSFTMITSSHKLICHWYLSPIIPHCVARCCHTCTPEFCHSCPGWNWTWYNSRNCDCCLHSDQRPTLQPSLYPEHHPCRYPFLSGRSKDHGVHMPSVACNWSGSVRMTQSLYCRNGLRFPLDTVFCQRPCTAAGYFRFPTSPHG